MTVPIRLALFRSSVSAWGLLAATWLSTLGNAVVMVAVPWLVLQRTGSAALTGIVAAAAFAPLVLAALFGGALVDRWGRRRASIAADLLSAAAVAALPLLDLVVGLELVPLVVLVALGAIFDGPGEAAREAMRPDVAARAGWPLGRVNSRAEAIEGLADLTGPAVAGLLVVAVGPMSTLWLTAGLLVAAALATTVMVRAQSLEVSAAHRPGSPATTNPRETYRSAVRAGLRAVWDDPTLRGSGILAMAIVAVTAPLTVVVLPAHLRMIGGASGLGVVPAALAAGGIAGALATPALLRRTTRRRVLLTSLLGIAASLLAFTAASGVAQTAVVAALLGLLAGPLNPVLAVLIQERTPEPLRARVIGTTTSLALAAAPPAFLAAGLLVQVLGLSAAFTLCAVGALLAAAYCGWAPGLRDLRPPGPAPLCATPTTSAAGAR